MTARLFTTITKPSQVFDVTATVHLAKLVPVKGWVTDCGTRVNNAQVEMQTPKQYITCEKCVRKLKREGIL